MDIRPTNTSSRSSATHLRHKPVLRLLLVLAAGLALFGLALVVPRSMSAEPAASPATADRQPSLQPFDPSTSSGHRYALRQAVGEPVELQDRLPTSNLQPPNPEQVRDSNLQPSSLLLAGVVNGGFETGLTNWSTSGSANKVEVLQVSDWTTSIGDVGRPVPTEGNYFVLLSTGHGAIGGAQGNIDLDGLATQDFDTSYLTTILNPTASDVPATLSFDWSFLTAEEPTGQGIFDDFFRVRLNSVIILSGSRPYGGVSPFPDVGWMDNIRYTVNSTGTTNGSYFGYGRSSFQTFRMIINDPGPYTLEFLIADQGDANDDSGLLIDNVQLIPEIDLEITKTATPDPAIAGEPLIYEVTVINHGSGRAEDVVVTDTLPTAVDFITDTLPVYADPDLPQGCTFDSGNNQLLCDLGDVLGGESVSFEIEVDVDSDALANGTEALLNTAEVDSLTADGNSRNDVIILETILQDSADLRVVKISTPDTSVDAGEIFTYTIHVDNLGPSHARNVVLTDTILSSGVFTLLQVIPDDERSDSCAINGTIITCELDQSLEPQGDPPRNGRWVIEVQVQADEAQDVNNEVIVFSTDPDGSSGPQTATPDPDTSNNRVTDFISVTAVADLKMTKIGEDIGSDPDNDPDTVLAGERVRWTIVVVNDGGPSTAQNVAVVDILPRGLVEGSVTAVAETPSPGGGQCTLGTPGDPNEPLICQLGNLAPSDTATVTIEADVDPSYVIDQPNTQYANHLPNDAYLTSDTFDPEEQNNIVFDTLVEVTAEVELEVQKTDRPDYVIAGELLEYTLTISNGGPSTAEDVVLLDELPDEVVALYVNVINEPDATCTIRTTPANVIDCGFGNIVPGKVITLVITSLVHADTPAGPITNTATVSSLTSDPGPIEGEDPNPNEVEEGTDVKTEADLKITKTSDPDKVYAGEQKKYTILVENLGPSDAQTVTVTDTLPISLTYEIDTDHCRVVDSTPEGAQVLECRYGRQLESGFVFEPLPAGETWQFDIWALVDPAIEVQPGLEPSVTVTNTAEVTGTTTLGDPYEVNNTDTAKNLVLQKADLKITKFGKPDGEVEAGQVLTYTIIVDNLGPSYAGIDGRAPVVGNVAIKDILQSDLQFDLLEITSDRDMTCSSVPSDGDPTDGIIGVNQHLEIDCTLLNALEVLSADGPPNSGRWIITASVTASETQDINNVVEVVSDAFDPNTDNNHAEVMHEITDVADLEVTKAAVGEVRTSSCDPPLIELRPNEVTAGLSLTYTLVITNHGPSTAENVVLEDRLPPWIVVTGFDTSQGDCDTGTPGEPLDKLTCGLGTLAPHASATVTVTADVPSWVPEGTILENDAYVYSDIWDPTNANNFASNLTTVSAWADLDIGKTDNPDSVVAGEQLNYTITVTNSGPSDALGVVVVDELPNAGALNDPLVTYLSDTDACYQDPIDRAKLTCSLGDIPAGESISFDILVLVNPDVRERGYPSITNSVTVSSDTADPCADNNSDTEDTAVGEEADLFITKVDVPAEVRLDQTFEPDQAIAGEEHRYLITFGNDGPSVAQNVAVTDTLDLKQAGILGEIFVRCEPVDPDDQVTCSEAGGIVTLNQLKVTNQAILPGNLDPGDEYSFYLITEVDAGYVLDADDLTAEDTAWVSSDTPDPNTANNQDTEQTEIIAEADLEVTKTDTPDPGQNLHYDPVTHKFTYTYTLTIENLGPSDAAKVVLIDTLPVDATFIEFGTLEDTECYFRDDGTVFCLVGNDENNQTVAQAGRLNAGSSKDVEIVVEVDASAVDFLENCVEVKAIGEFDFPFRRLDTIDDPIEPADFLDGRTPTPDPNLANNTFCELTSLVNPAVQVDKKVYVRYSPVRGIDNRGLDPVDACADLAADDILTLPGDELTYCYTITNEGDTWLSSVTLQDLSDALLYRLPLDRFEIAYPSQPPLRGTITWDPASPGGDTDEAQTITIETPEFDKAVLAPQGVADDYDYILIFRSFTVDFPAGGTTYLGTNTARVDARPSTKYSTPLPGIAASGDCDPKLPEHVCDTDLLNDTLALPVLEGTTKEWDVCEDADEDGVPGCDDIMEYTVTIPNTGTIEATGVVFTDTLYNYIADDPDDWRVPATLINGSVSAAIHVYGMDPVSGREIDADVAPPDLAFGEDLLLRTAAPTVDGGYIELTYPSAVVLDGEIIKGNNDGDDEILVATRLAIPPQGELVRFDGVTYDPPIPVTFSLRIKYRVHVKRTMPNDAVVLNHGWLTYNEIGLFDQRFPNFDPANPNANTAANKAANNHAGTPGRAWESYEFPGWPEVPEGVEPTDYPGPRFDDYAQPGADVRDDDDPTWFEVKCGTGIGTMGTGTHLQLPAIDHQGGWETWIQVQNAGNDDVGVVTFFWGEYSAQCPYSDPGPIGYACKWVAKDGVWSLEDQDIPVLARSAIVYSVSEALFDQACLDAAQVIVEPHPYWDPTPKSAKWRAWVDDYEGTGLPLAVITQREGPNDFDTLVSSAYPGISENMKGCGPPYQYFAPYAMRQYQNLDTEIIIQNCGERCTEIWLDYQKQGDCEFSYSDHIGRLAPGESIRKRVPAALGAEWLGSIYIESDEPLGIVIDQTSLLPSDDRGALLTYEAFPYDLTKDKVWYADLVFRELSGWEASIQVQNLTQDSMPTFVTVEFFDASGDSILFLGEWVCLHGGATFYLPAIVDLGMTYAGAAVIESHGQVDYPGGMHDGEPIFVVVDLKKTKVYDENLHRWRHTIPGEVQGGAYNARAESDKGGPGPIWLPFLSKAKNDQGVTSLIAVRNNSNCNNIAIELEVRKGTGTVISYVSNFWLNTGHVKLIDLANVGSLNPGFLGSGTVEVVNAEQLCDLDHDGEPDQEPVMPSVVVVNKGTGVGDITAVYKGIRGGEH